MTTAAVRVFLLCLCSALPATAQEDPAAPAMEFVTIKPGTFRMGCSEGDKLCDPDENPPHQVRLTKSFALAKYEVTQAQWSALMPANQSRFQGPTLPVENVSFDQVQEFLKRMNDRKDGFTYRLPPRPSGNMPPAPEQPVRIQDRWATWPGTVENSGGKSHPVGEKKPNAWGLYDMEGNVYEWTQDWFFDYEEDPLTDPKVLKRDTNVFRAEVRGKAHRKVFERRIAINWNRTPAITT
jgi:formylglycine-generating enzyme required for sulfatase activity